MKKQGTMSKHPIVKIGASESGAYKPLFSLQHSIIMFVDGLKDPAF